MSKVKPFLAVVFFIVWSQYALHGVRFEGLLLQGIIATAISYLLIYFTLGMKRQWVYYLGLVVIAITKHVTEGHGYFFFFLTGLLLLGNFLYSEI